MAEPSKETLAREVDEQTRIYKKLQSETNSLIASQRGLIKALGLQRNSILGSVAHAGMALRESIKTAQLKLQERKALESQLALAKRSADTERQKLEHAARLTMSLTGDRKSKAQQIADGYAKTYDTARKREQSIANQLTETPSKAAIAFSAGAEILKSGVHVASVAFSKIGGVVNGATTAIIGFVNSIKKTQEDFGVSMQQALQIQMQTIAQSITGIVTTFKSLDFTGLGNVVGTTIKGFFNFGRNLSGAFRGEGTYGGAFGDLTTILKGAYGDLTARREGKAAVLPVLGAEEIQAGTKSLQDEFGVFDFKTGEAIAKLARERGLTTQQVVQARRVFATQTLGDYRKVEQIQNNFLGVFEKKGMTAKTAMEVIAKYSDLMARNGLRFANAFARAAADAKAIGVDLGKVDQVGDNIIDNFEGFLEKQAELGAMGFNLDSSRLAEIAESGDTGALFNELRSQLAATGKDITKLRRSEQLALQNAFGLSMSDIMRLSGKTPEQTKEEAMQQDQTNLLNHILAAMSAAGPIVQALSGPMGLVFAIGGVVTAIGVLTDVVLRGFAAIPGIGGKFEAERQARQLFSENQPYQARNVLRQAGIEKSVIEQMTQEWLSKEGIQEQIQSGKIRNVSFSPSTNRNIFYDPTRQMQPGYEYLNPGGQWPGGNADVIKKASGGFISGPGTSTSDSIPTMLSDGEYVLPAALVSKIGVSNLDRLRSAVGNTDYVRLMSALMAGDMKQVAKISAGIGVEEIVRRFTLGSSALAAGTVMAGKDVYDTYQANKDKPYPTWWSTRAPGEVPKWVQRKKDGGLIKNISGMYDIYKQGGIGGVKSNLLGTAGSFLSGKVPGLSSSINAFTQGGVGGLKSNLLGTAGSFLSGKIPGLSGAMSTFSAFKQGGVKGALGSLAKGGIGKAIGGAIGTAIPIPGVGTMIGSVLGSKLGKFAGGLFGKKKTNVVPMGMESTPSPDLSMMLGPQQMQQSMTESRTPTVDTSGIEQKLNNFINALQNIQINMDGNQVGKVLVKTSEAAASLGVFRTQAR